MSKSRPEYSPVYRSSDGKSFFFRQKPTPKNPQVIATGRHSNGMLFNIVSTGETDTAPTGQQRHAKAAAKKR